MRRLTHLIIFFEIVDPGKLCRRHYEYTIDAKYEGLLKPVVQSLERMAGRVTVSCGLTEEIYTPNALSIQAQH